MRVDRKHSYLVLLITMIWAIPAEAKDRPAGFLNPERYYCTAHSDGIVGKLDANRELDGEGKPVTANVNWTAGDIVAGPAIMVAWQVALDDPVHFPSGIFSGKVPIGTPENLKIGRSSKFRMEITTHSESGWWKMPGAFVGQYLRWKDFASNLGVVADWNDLFAMARGAGSILIVARDKQSRLLGSHPVSYAMLEQARDEAMRLSIETHGMAKDYRNKCRHEAANNEIII